MIPYDALYDGKHDLGVVRHQGEGIGVQVPAEGGGVAAGSGDLGGDGLAWRLSSDSKVCIHREKRLVSGDSYGYSWSSFSSSGAEELPEATDASSVEVVPPDAAFSSSGTDVLSGDADASSVEDGLPDAGSFSPLSDGSPLSFARTENA